MNSYSYNQHWEDRLGLYNSPIVFLRKDKTPTTTNNNNNNKCPDITLNRIWSWESSPRALGNVEYPFIAITPRYTLSESVITC